MHTQKVISMVLTAIDNTIIDGSLKLFDSGEIVARAEFKNGWTAIRLIPVPDKKTSSWCAA